MATNLAKRGLDVSLASVALLLVSPFLLVVMALLRVTAEREVFFRQQRVGWRERPFGLLKFATMLRDSPASGTVTAENDPRVLPVGRFLRRTKINELPQLLNVLRGDMSLVGPRPLTRQAFEFYPPAVRRVIAEMQPGITGVGSLILRNEEKLLAASPKGTMTCYAEDVIPLKGALECWYAERRGFWVDLKILCLTALAVVSPADRRIARWLGVEPIVRRSALCPELLPE